MTEHESQSDATAEANARQIEGELDRLVARLEERPVHFRDFWGHVKEVNSLFRELKPLSKDDRELLWKRVGSACEKAKELQEEFHRQSESRRAVSANKRSLVEGKIHDAHGYAKAGRTPSDLAKARDLLNEALGWMKNGWCGFNNPTQLFAFDDGKMLKSDSDACWDKWREANDALQMRRQELGDVNFGHFRGEAEETIGIAEYDPKRAKDRVKEVQQEMRGKIMTGDQFDEVRKLLDKAWEQATGKQKERHEDWRERQLEYIRRKRELIERTEEAIDAINGQIDHCRELEAGARTESYAQEVRGWIEEKYGWIESKRRFIEELEEQIREIESRLKS